MEYTLRNGCYVATVRTLGGELISFQDGDGTERLWQGDPAYWSGRNPILFPAVGAVKGGVRFAGQSYPLSRHGFVRGREFALAERGEDWAALELTESQDTLEQYPYPFRLRVTHRLTETGFETAYLVKNTGGSPMPFCIGGHTAYRCPLYPGESFEDYRLVFDQTENARSIAVGPGGLLGGYLPEPCLMGTDTICLRHEIFDKADTLIFEGLRSQSVRLVSDKTGRGVSVRFGQFPMLGIWTMPGKNAPYLCVEPWQGCGAYADETGDFEDKPYAVTLAPGEEKRLAFQAAFF